MSISDFPILENLLAWLLLWSISVLLLVPALCVAVLWKLRNRFQERRFFIRCVGWSLRQSVRAAPFVTARFLMFMACGLLGLGTVGLIPAYILFATLKNPLQFWLWALGIGVGVAWLLAVVGCARMVLDDSAQALDT